MLLPAPSLQLTSHEAKSQGVDGYEAPPMGVRLGYGVGWRGPGSSWPPSHGPQGCRIPRVSVTTSWGPRLCSWKAILFLLHRGKQQYPPRSRFRPSDSLWTALCDWHWPQLFLCCLQLSPRFGNLGGRAVKNWTCVQTPTTLQPFGSVWSLDIDIMAVNWVWVLLNTSKYGLVQGQSWSEVHCGF